MSNENKEKNRKKGWIAILKSDPQTLEEANQKTKFTLLFLGIVACVFIALFFLLHFWAGVISAVACLGLFLYLRFKFNQQNKRNFCPDCGTRYDYGKCVSWEVAKTERKAMDTNANTQGKRIVQKETATVHFTCTCESCGSKKEFSEKFDVTLWYSDGSREDRNIQTYAENYFKL